jgi:anti-anti-sigma factor
MELKNKQYNQWTVVEIYGSVDDLNTKALIDALLEIVGQNTIYLVLDLKNTAFLSLPAIQFLAGTAKLLSAKGGALSVIGPNERIKKHLETFATFKDMSCLSNFSELDSGQWVKMPTSHAF